MKIMDQLRRKEKKCKLDNLHAQYKVRFHIRTPSYVAAYLNTKPLKSGK
jgi:hypothetical protein